MPFLAPIFTNIKLVTLLYPSAYFPVTLQLIILDCLGKKSQKFVLNFGYFVAMFVKLVSVKKNIYVCRLYLGVKILADNKRDHRFQKSVVVSFNAFMRGFRKCQSSGMQYSSIKTLLMLDETERAHTGQSYPVVEEGNN